MEYLTYKYPMFAITSSNLFPTFKVSEMIIIAYMLLTIMWLKFLLIWRFFRLWSLLDHIESVPENMLRCMSNNYSLQQFWKGWHSSFNKWLIKYMYIPLGGSKYKIISGISFVYSVHSLKNFVFLLIVWLIFIFVALWHDIEWKLLIWGLLNSIFLIIEVYLIKRKNMFLN